MKKMVIITVFAIVAGLFSGCSGNLKDDGTYQIVCTTFPIYDWVLNIVGDENDNIEVELLLDNGVDMHSFQPGAKEIAMVSGCDLLIYIGGESDAWIEDAIKESINDRQKTISLLALLGEDAKEEDELLGNGDAAHIEHSDEIEYDEHVWLSLTNAYFFVECIAYTLGELDGARSEIYQKNADSYGERLLLLHADAKEKLDLLPDKTIVVADRFPFRYLVDDYNIKYYAAFPGCSAETEASFDVVVRMSENIDNEKLKFVVVTESADMRLVDTVIENTKNKNQEIITIDSMQTITLKEYKSGKNYYSIMKDNLEKLIKVVE